MIENRPKYLEDISFYQNIPAGVDIGIDFSSLPPLFNLDLHQLNGLQPLTSSMFDYIRQPNVNGEKQISTVTVNPSEKEIEYYKANEMTEWQLVSIVINLYDFKKEGKTLIGKPYSVSLFPGSKRGEVDPWHIDLIRKMNIESTLGGGNIYSESNPFSGWYGGFFGQYSLLAASSGITSHSDSIGFVYSQYLLNPKFDKREVQILVDQSAPNYINSKFKKYRIKLFFEPFKDVMPRKIWGCESPIELFLLQGLAKNDLYPEIQTLIFRNGDIYPSYHLMIEEHLWQTQDNLISNVDFYFHEKKLAIFCDGRAYHDAEKDGKIDSKLRDLGIKSLRFNGKQLTEDLESVIETIKTELKNN